MNPSTTPVGVVPKSVFVPVLSWLFLAIGVLVGLGALLDLFAIVVAPAAALGPSARLLQDSVATRVLPGYYLFALRHVVLLTVIRCLWCAGLVAACVGLLRRRDWARRLLIGLLTIGCIGFVAWFFLYESAMMDLAARTARLSGTGQVPSSLGSGMATGGLFLVGLVAVLVWLVIKLRSASVRAEFATAERAV